MRFSINLSVTLIMLNVLGSINPSAVCMTQHMCSKLFKETKQFGDAKTRDEVQLYFTYCHCSSESGSKTTPWIYCKSGGLTAEKDQKEAVNRPKPGAKVTEWFSANKTCLDARNIKDSKFPCYFSWNMSKTFLVPSTKLRVLQLQHPVAFTKDGKDQKFFDCSIESKMVLSVSTRRRASDATREHYFYMSSEQVISKHWTQLMVEFI